MFSFLTPAGTIALLAGIAFPVLIALYFLKLRRIPLLVPSTLLWKKAVEDLAVNAPFQRLRRNLLLILQLLVLLLLILSLAQPTLFNVRTSTRRVVLLIDQSASMSATDVAPSRLALAQDRARQYLDNLPDSTEVMLVAFASRARLISAYTTQHRQVRAEIDRIGPTQGQSRVAEALQLAEAYAQVGTAQVQDAVQVPDNPNLFPTIVLFSDGCLDDLKTLTPRRSRIEWQRVGGPAPAADPAEAPAPALVPNVAVLNFDARRDYERPERVSAFARVQNFGPQPVSLEVRLYRGDTLQQVLPVTLGAYLPPASQPAGAGSEASNSKLNTQNSELSSRSLTFKPFDQDAPGVLRVALANLSQPDDLALDNTAFRVLSAPKMLRVLLVTPGNFFLERVLRNLPVQGVDVILPAQWESAGPPQDPRTGQRVHDVVVFDRVNVEESKLPPGNYLFFGGFPASAAVRMDGLVENELLTDWNDADPLLRHVTLGYVYAAKWPRLKLSDQARVLVHGETTPVIFEMSHARQRYVVVAFDLLDSNWPLKVSFPVFCYNAIRHLGDTLTTADQPLRPGDPLVVPLRPAAESAAPAEQTVTLTLPDKTKVTQRVRGKSEVIFADTLQQGVYTVDGPVAGLNWYAINLFDPVESNLTPPVVLTLGASGQTVVGENAPGRTNLDLWPWVALAGLGLILLEWWVYNRRVYV